MNHVAANASKTSIHPHFYERESRLAIKAGLHKTLNRDSIAEAELRPSFIGLDLAMPKHLLPSTRPSRTAYDAIWKSRAFQAILPDELRVRPEHASSPNLAAADFATRPDLERAASSLTELSPGLQRLLFRNTREVVSGWIHDVPDVLHEWHNLPNELQQPVFDLPQAFQQEITRHYMLAQFTTAHALVIQETDEGKRALFLRRLVHQLPTGREAAAFDLLDASIRDLKSTGAQSQLFAQLATHLPPGHEAAYADRLLDQADRFVGEPAGARISESVLHNLPRHNADKLITRIWTSLNTDDTASAHARPADGMIVGLQRTNMSPHFEAFLHSVPALNNTVNQRALIGKLFESIPLDEFERHATSLIETSARLHPDKLTDILFIGLQKIPIEVSRPLFDVVLSHAKSTTQTERLGRLVQVLAGRLRLESAISDAREIVAFLRQRPAISTQVQNQIYRYMATHAKDHYPQVISEVLLPLLERPDATAV